MRATEQPRAEIVVIDTPTLGDRSYLVHDGRVAVVIDPQRDIDRVLALAAEHAVRITHVFETHVHNDYVTGGLALASAARAAYHVNATDAVAFDRVPVRDGDVIEVSPVMRIRVIATPGHTFTHLSYVLEIARQPPAVFTGVSLLYGSTGRPDLMGAARAAELLMPSTPRRIAWRLACRRTRMSIPRTGSAASARPANPGVLPRPSAGSGESTLSSPWTSSDT